MAKIANEATMTQEEKNEFVRAYEDDILGGLIAAASYKINEEDFARIDVKRGKKVVLSFRIRPMSEEEYLQCRKDNTVYKKNKNMGTRVADHVNTARYRCQLIYEATVEEDRNKIWDNRKAWEQIAVTNGIDLIEAVLMAGEKDAILDKLDEISGYQPTLEETAKN